MKNLKARLNQLEKEGHELTELKANISELEQTGSTRIYERNGYDLVQLMNTLEETLDFDYFAYGLEEINNNGLFVEIVKHTSERAEDMRWN